MTINCYSYLDASAPVMRGVVGDLTTLLDACLVNGYGSQTAAGWAIPYTATNKRVYRAPSGNRMYLSVDDTNPAPGSYGAQNARVSSYESMSSVSAGVNPIPTALQVAALSLLGTGSVLVKSSSADTVQRPWFLFANETFFHLLIFISNTLATGATFSSSIYIGGIMYGDLVQPQKAGDAFHTLLVCGVAQGYTSNFFGAMTQTTPALTPGHWLQRPYTQFNSGIGCAKGLVGRNISNVSVMGADTNAPNFPEPISGGLVLSEVWIYENCNGQYSPRGKVPGIFSSLHNYIAIQSAFNVGDQIPGAGTYAGLTFQTCSPGVGSICFFQVNGSWT